MTDLGLMPVTAFSLLVGEDLKECGKSACRRIRMGVYRDACRLVDGISPWHVPLSVIQTFHSRRVGTCSLCAYRGLLIVLWLIVQKQSDAEEKENKKSGLSHDCPDLTIK